MVSRCLDGFCQAHSYPPQAESSCPRASDFGSRASTKGDTAEGASPKRVAREPEHDSRDAGDEMPRPARSTQVRRGSAVSHRRATRAGPSSGVSTSLRRKLAPLGTALNGGCNRQWSVQRSPGSPAGFEVRAGHRRDNHPRHTAQEGRAGSTADRSPAQASQSALATSVHGLEASASVQ